jgi:Asp/Glu/hydantoin racemase
MLHTVSSLVPTFQGLCEELLPGIETFHMVDESLLKNTIRSGELTPTTTRRVLGHVASAEEAGADAVLVTCSSIGPAVALSRSVVSVPVVRVDEAMADLAVETGSRIGVIATLPTTLHPTVELVQARADAAGTPVTVTAHLCAGAFEALGRGNTATHDALVADGLRRLLCAVDVVVLAQASMARVANTLPEEDRRVPILSSPRSAVERARTILLGAADAEPVATADRVPTL